MRYTRRRKITKMCLAIVLITAAAFTASNFLMDRHSEELVVAKVNDQEIFISDIEKKLSDIFDGNTQNIRTPDVNKLPQEVLKLLAKEIYLEQALTEKALKSDVEDDPKVLNDMNEAKNNILRRAYLEKITTERVTPEAVNTKYLSLSEKLDGKKEYLVSHIVVKEEKEARKILKKINASKSKNDAFSEMAAKHSIDSSSADKGGQIDYILEDDMIEEIMQVTQTLDNGAISDPIKSQFGWHLVKIDDVRNAQLPPFEEVKNNIESQLRQDALNQINAEIIDNVTIEILIALEKDDEQEQE